jgi:hypothetical protein
MPATKTTNQKENKALVIAHNSVTSNINVAARVIQNSVTLNTGKALNAANPLLTKRVMAKVLACSVRQVDNYLADGMPHQKPSIRKVTFDRNEVMQWYKEKFGQRRRK